MLKENCKASKVIIELLNQGIEADIAANVVSQTERNVLKKRKLIAKRDFNYGITIIIIGLTITFINLVLNSFEVAAFIFSIMCMLLGALFSVRAYLHSN